MNLLSKIIPRLGILSEDDFLAVNDRFTIKEYSAGDVVLKAGQICRKLYFIQAGGVYALANDESERILWYEFDGSSFTDFIGSYSHSACNFTIKVAENNTIIASISFDELEDIYIIHHSWAIWGARFYQKEISRLTYHYENLRTKDASQRYHELVEAYPEILQRVPLGHIASYLGISQVSLSRIRSGKQKK